MHHVLCFVFDFQKHFLMKKENKLQYLQLHSNQLHLLGFSNGPSSILTIQHPWYDIEGHQQDVWVEGTSRRRPVTLEIAKALPVNYCITERIIFVYGKTSTSIVGSGPKSNSSATVIPCKMSLKKLNQLYQWKTSFQLHGKIANAGYCTTIDQTRTQENPSSLQNPFTSKIFHYFLQMYHFRLHSFWFLNNDRLLL